MGIAEQKNKAVFLDKDGTLIPDIPYNVNADLISISTETIAGIRQMKSLGYRIIIVSNQPGIARGYFTARELNRVWTRINHLLRPYDLVPDGYYYCPHHEEGIIPRYTQACNCRKPGPGLILKAAARHHIDLGSSWMIGDILNDVEAGNRAGCRTILIDNGNETEWILTPQRRPEFRASDLREAASFIKAETITIKYHEI